MTKIQGKQAKPAGVATTKALSEAQVRKALAEGRKVRHDLERRIAKMHRVDPADAAARAR